MLPGGWALWGFEAVTWDEKGVVGPLRLSETAM